MRELEQRIDSLTQSTPSIPCYHVFAHKSVEAFANRFAEQNPQKFKKMRISWDRFPDDTDNITIDALNTNDPAHQSYGHPHLENKDLIFIASFQTSQQTLAQLHAITYLSESLPRSLTIILPFYITGTMERTELGKEGSVATAHTMAVLLNGACRACAHVRLMVYDLHTLQNRFYFVGGHIQATLHTAIPLIAKQIRTEASINCIVFPDDGAHKRFGAFFGDNLEVVICAKQRTDAGKVVTISSGDPKGKDAIIIDDMTRSGGTLKECAEVLRKRKAKSVSAYVTHAAFVRSFWDHRVYEAFDKVFATDSVPGVRDDIATNGAQDYFHILPLAPQMLKDLEWD